MSQEHYFLCQSVVRREIMCVLSDTSAHLHCYAIHDLFCIWRMPCQLLIWPVMQENVCHGALYSTV